MSLMDRVKPATEKQKMVLVALDSKDADLVGVFGPSGTGKSFLTCIYGVDAVLNGKYERFVIIRPLVDLKTGKEYTAVELGELYFKLASSYLYDILSGYVGEDELRKLINGGKIVLADPTFLRGRTFDRALILLDDAQLASFDTLTETIIRMGTGSKLVVAGDPVFQVGEDVEKNGAAIARELFLGEERAVVVDFGIKDMVRPGAKRGFRLTLETRLRKRKLNEEERKILDTSYIHAPDADIVTVVWVKDLKEKYQVGGNAPDALIISKEGYLGRLIGRGGERINKVEDDTGYSIRAVELTVDLKNIVVALHPLGWIGKHIVDVDLVGPNLEVSVKSSEFGAFVGQRGSHVRFIDEAMRRMLGIGVRARSVEERGKRSKKRR